MADVMAKIRNILLDNGDESGSDDPRSKRIVTEPIAKVMAAMGAVPARDGVREIGKRGFVPLPDDELRRRVAGKTLKISDSYAFFAADRTVRIVDMSLGGGIESHGTWTVKNRQLCYSVGGGREFCSGLYFRGDEVLCWPGIGTYRRDTGYLRECRILSGKAAF